MMDIRPIKTENDYDVALKEIDRLVDAAPGTPNADRLEILSTLVVAYEEEHYPIPTPDPVEAIRYYMESRGLSQKDLEPYIGDREKVKQVLQRKRPLSIAMIRRLHNGLGISADVLIQPYAKAA